MRAARPALAAVLLPALAALGLSLALGAERFFVYGRVKSVAGAGESFEVTDKTGDHAVALPRSATVRAFEARRLRELAGTRASVYVLGRQVPRRGEEPAHVDKVAAIVGGAGFAPGPVPDDLARRGIGWMGGTLSSDDGPVRVGSFEVKVGWEKRIPVLVEGGRERLLRGTFVFVEGERARDRAKMAMTASRVTIIAPEVPQAEWRAILDF